MRFEGLGTMARSVGSRMQAAVRRPAAAEVAVPKVPEASSVADVPKAPEAPTDVQKGAAVIEQDRAAGQRPQQSIEDLASGRVRSQAEEAPPTAQPTKAELDQKRDQTRVVPTDAVKDEGGNQPEVTPEVRLYEEAQKDTHPVKDSKQESKDTAKEIGKRIDSLSEKQQYQYIENVNKHIAGRVEQLLASENVSKELMELILVQNALVSKYADLLQEKNEEKKRMGVKDILIALVLFLGKEAWSIADPLEGLQGGQR